jgi:uncharacterized protein YuzE
MQLLYLQRVGKPRSSKLRINENASRLSWSQLRLTDERLAHILERPEMKQMGDELENVLRQPRLCRCSRSDDAARLFYQFYEGTMVGGKWLCVVVKYEENDAFVITAYLDRQTESWRRLMADKVKVWFDAEADYLEVRFSDAAGYMKETKNDALMERVDAQGRIIGFSVMGVSRFKKDKPLEADLAPA